MKILQVVSNLAWVYGGAPTAVYNLAHKLAERGHDVTIYATDVGPSQRLTDGEKIKSGDRLKIRYFRCLNNWIAQRWKLQISSQMRSAFNAEIKDFDIIHTNETRGFHNVCVALCAEVWRALRVSSAWDVANGTRTAS